jgi:hypothetical protein
MVTPDLLSASSLLVTCIGALFAGWQHDISRAIGKSGLTGQARKDHANLLAGLILFRAAPLAASSIALAAVLFWPWLSVLSGIRPDREYDPVAACFVVVYLLILLLAGSAVTATIRLMRRRRALR